MVATPKEPYFSPEEYLQIEEQSPIKHEYIDGRLFAMVGASQGYNILRGNLLVALHGHVRSSGCRVFFSDIKVRIEQRNRFFYPDIAVSCDARDRETPLYLRYPNLIVEILSDSTEAFDRGDKFEDYQTIETLREYVLVSSKRPLVQCFRRSNSGLWELQSYTEEQGNFQFSSLDFSLTLESLYEDVTF
ncbi:MAG: Uma2 family endonuclease [Anaerolineae bacterium]|nr:Uma2 family endonuclease [Gloeobacterales cyanobacterium ES-bin-313]